MPLPTTQHTPAARALHLVDLENLAACQHVTIDAAIATAEQYRTTADRRPGDLTVVGSSHHNGFAARVAFPEATVRWRSGRDGADLALIDALDEFDLGRFGRVVIGSGDGIFADVADRCRRQGVTVTVVARPTAIAHRLATVSDAVAPFTTVAPFDAAAQLGEVA